MKKWCVWNTVEKENRICINCSQPANIKIGDYGYRECTLPPGIGDRLEFFIKKYLKIKSCRGCDKRKTALNNIEKRIKTFPKQFQYLFYSKIKKK